MRNKKIVGLAKKYLASSTRKILKEKILTTRPGKPKMDSNDKEVLFNYYKDDVKKVEDLLGRKLPWRNFTSDITDQNKKTE